MNVGAFYRLPAIIWAFLLSEEPGDEAIESTQFFEKYYGCQRRFSSPHNFSNV